MRVGALIMKGLWGRMKKTWPRYTLLPAVPFVAAGLVWAIKRRFRWDHAAMMTAVPALAYASPSTKRLYQGMLPFFLTGVLYDLSRLANHWGIKASRVQTVRLRNLDRKLFGIRHRGQKVTLADFFQHHQHPALDALAALPYATYFFLPLGYGLYLYRRDRQRLAHFGWAFFGVTVAGMTTWHLIPAAPPWYVRRYGKRIDWKVTNTAGEALLRVDKRLGTHFFEGLYGRGSHVFGALPSLHMAYPFLVLLASQGKHRWPVRATLAGYTATMGFAAVYLDHHWVLDLAAGLGYGAAAYEVAGWLTERKPVAEQPQLAPVIELPTQPEPAEPMVAIEPAMRQAAE